MSRVALKLSSLYAVTVKFCFNGCGIQMLFPGVLKFYFERHIIHVTFEFSSFEFSFPWNMVLEFQTARANH
jgi:hypothetical protein